MLAVDPTYKPLYKPNQLICGSGHTVVVTGWTVKQAIANQLKADEYAAIGQLYSPTRGISFLVRNLLANPHARFLVVFNITKEDRNAGGSQCLLDFFHHGFDAGISDTGKPCWVIRSPMTGYISGEIDQEALELLRKSITVLQADSLKDGIRLIKECGRNITEPWGVPLTFPLQQNNPTILPGPRYGHRIEGKTIAETWVKIIHRIKTTGTIRPTGYDGQWQELIDLVAVVTDEPPGFYFPEPNYLPVSREFVDEYLSQVLDDAPKREGVKYTYGQRLRSWFGQDQIEQVINKLIHEIDAASAVMSLWDVADHEKGGSPCLNHIWVRVVNNEISLTATLRSNDMFAAWVANAMGLRALQQHIRDEICQRSDYELSIGPLITVSQSAHIYDDTWENCDRLIADQYQTICQQRDYYDPSGNFLIEIEDEEIVVTHTTPGSGEVVTQYRGKNPLKLIQKICAATPVIQPDHAGYLGIEIHKAFQSLKEGNPYIQDQG